MAKLTWSGGDRWKDDDGKWKDPVPVTLDMDMTEADFSKKGLGAEGAIILAAFIKRKTFQDKGALAFLTMHEYKLPIREIKTAKELDLSNKELSLLDATVIATLIKVQTALCSQKEIKLKEIPFRTMGPCILLMSGGVV